MTHGRNRPLLSSTSLTAYDMFQGLIIVTPDMVMEAEKSITLTIIYHIYGTDMALRK